MRWDEVGETFRVIFLRIRPDDDMWQKISELLTVLTVIKEDVNNEAEKLVAEVNIQSQTVKFFVCAENIPFPKNFARKIVAECGTFARKFRIDQPE